MYRVILFIVALALSGCITSGENGKDGKDGTDGKDASTFRTSGILYTASMVDDHWDIEIGSTNIDKHVLQVWVRSGPGFMWRQPTWFLDQSLIRIIDDSLVEAQWEYQIISAGE